MPKIVKVIGRQGNRFPVFLVKGEPPINMKIQGPFSDYVSRSGLHWVKILDIRKTRNGMDWKSLRYALFRGVEIAKIDVTDWEEQQKYIPGEGKNVTPLPLEEYKRWEEDTIRTILRGLPYGRYVAVYDTDSIRLFSVWGFSDIIAVIRDTQPLVRQSNLEIWRVSALFKRDKRGDFYNVIETMPNIYNTEDGVEYEIYGRKPLVLGGHSLWFTNADVHVAQAIPPLPPNVPPDSDEAILYTPPEIALMKTFTYDTKVLIRHHSHKDVTAVLPAETFYIVFHRPRMGGD